MAISEWLDEKEAKNLDVSQIALPEDLSYDEVPDETIFFKEINPCGFFCTGNHPFSTVERFGNWYYCRGRDKEAGIHTVFQTVILRNEIFRNHLVVGERKRSTH